MATKMIHFVVNGREETAEFGLDCSDADVKDLFLAAAEVGPDHILKLFSSDGRLLKICSSLQENLQSAPYRLQLASDSCVAVPTQLGAMETRLQQLEHRVMELSRSPELLQDLNQEVEGFKRKLQSVEHLSWMGLFRENTEKFIHKTGPRLMSAHEGPRSAHEGPRSAHEGPRGAHEGPRSVHEGARSAHEGPRSAHEERQRVRSAFLNMSSLQVSEEVREHLKTPMFDNWQWEEPEMLVLIQTMFEDLDFVVEFQMETRVLQNFLLEVHGHYNQISFHNFHHCFCVTQMMYGLIWLTELRTKLSRTDLLIMLTSALCHDLDHPGYNNVYQINAQTDLALRYNDISPLENHHCAVAFSIISKPDCNILKNVTSEQYKQIRSGMIKCILATDMARHNEILNKFRAIQPMFDFSNKEHKEVLMKILVKVSDISNEARPMSVAEPWLDRLLQEFFNQSDTEKLRGLPVTPFMDRDKVSKPSSQTNFIRFVLLPLFTELTKLFPSLQQHILEPVRRALEYYGELEKNAADLQNPQTKT